jgi:hypothetical protein
VSPGFIVTGNVVVNGSAPETEKAGDAHVVEVILESAADVSVIV